MNYYIDTEFWENGANEPIRLISIGIVAEDGRELYMENADFDWQKVPRDHWLIENVFPKMEHGDGPRCGYSLGEIAQRITAFVTARASNPVFYGYFSSYDWVVFCQIFGRMVDLPKGFPMYPMDLKQMMKERGLDSDWKRRCCPDTVDEHHALADARWNRALHKHIMDVDRLKEKARAYTVPLAVSNFRMPDPDELSKYVNPEIVSRIDELRNKSMSARITVLTRVAEALLGRPIDESEDMGRFRWVTSPAMMVKGEEQLVFDGKLVGSIRQNWDGLKFVWRFTPVNQKTDV